LQPPKIYLFLFVSEDNTITTYAYSEPAIFESEYQVSPVVQAYFATAGHVTLLTQIHRADLVILASGTLVRALTAASTTVGWVVGSGLLSGLAIHDETAVFTSTTTGAGAPPGGGGIGNLFGATAVSTAAATNLLPGEPGSVHVNKIFGGQMVEFSLDRAIPWATSLINSLVYLYLDGPSNLFYVSTTANSSTTIGTLVNVVVRATQGFIGDFGVRVLVNFSAAAVN